MRHPASTASLALGLATAFLLTGCAPGDDPADPGTTEGSSAEGSSAEASQRECLIGTWQADTDDLQTYYDVIASYNEGMVLALNGTAAFTYEGATWIYTPGFGFDMTVPGMSMPATAVVTGTVSGTYTAEAGMLTTEAVTNDLSMEVTIEGISVDVGEISNGLIAGSPIQSTAFECSGDELSVEFQTPGVPVPVVMTRVD